MITVNAAGCGKGKSTHNKQFIIAHASSRFLIIVPSLALADEYAEFGTAIHSGTTNNVKQQIYKAIDANTRVIVITQKAFLDFESKCLLCTHRIVLQDEHLEPFYMCKWQMANHLQWLDMFSVESTDKEDWYRVILNMPRVQQFLSTADMLDSKQFIDDLLATPQNIYTNKPTVEADSMLFRVVSPAIYEGASTVHIACANFTANRQYHLWSALFGVEFNITREFVPYATPNLTLHFAFQKRNSKTFNRGNSTIKATVAAYINSKCSAPVYVDNNVYDTQDGWKRVNHNCHGVNEFRNEAHIAILSAINYNDFATAFLVDVVGMTKQQVRYSLIGEIAHQVIMRGTLRSDNANECHVYLMEMELTVYLQQHVFSDSKYAIINGTERPERAPALTPIERKKATLIRKNFSEYADTPTDALLKEGIWTFTNTNGKYTKMYLQITAEHALHAKRMAER